MPGPLGNYAGLNLGPLLTAPGSHVPLNLGTDWDDIPPEPPEPIFRGIRTAADLPWGNAPRARHTISSGWHQSPQLRRETRVGWGSASPLQRSLGLAWSAPERYRQSVAMAWRSRMPGQRQSSSLPWRHQASIQNARRMPWQQQGMVRNDVSMHWRHPGLVRLSRALPWLAKLILRRGSALFPWGHPGLIKRTLKLPWGNAAGIPWVVRPPEVEPPEVPETDFPLGNYVGLNLGCAVITTPGFVPLNLGVTACYAVRPARRTYIVLNEISVVRLPDRTPIAVETISISGDVSAWGYSLDMGLADPAHLALLTPNVDGPRQVEVAINGYVWTFIIESNSHQRQFLTGGVSVSGRSRTALLASPYAPARAKVTSDDRNMAQLVDEELADTDYTATYDTVDWTVPAGAWYYDSTAPLDAISRLAEASGGVVQSHPEDLSLTVRARYPVSPWDWTETTPDVIVQDDIVTSLNLQVRSAPLYDAVVVSGEIAGKGVTARVKRDGEAGTLYAQQISHPLINTNDAAREHGRNALSDRGEQAGIDLTLPLFASPVLAGQTGRVLPLDLVEVQEASGTWHGLCTSLRLEARRDDKAIVVEQTITVERHYTDAD